MLEGLKRWGSFMDRPDRGQLDWGCSVPQLMTVDAGGEQSTESSWACALPPGDRVLNRTECDSASAVPLAGTWGLGSTQPSSGRLDVSFLLSLVVSNPGTTPLSVD